MHDIHITLCSYMPVPGRGCGPIRWHRARLVNIHGTWYAVHGILVQTMRKRHYRTPFSQCVNGAAQARALRPTTTVTEKRCQCTRGTYQVLIYMYVYKHGTAVCRTQNSRSNAKKTALPYNILAGTRPCPTTEKRCWCTDNINRRA